VRSTFGSFVLRRSATHWIEIPN